jgi:predicted RNase H-like nuclease (RuvC/YqgF family)
MAEQEDTATRQAVREVEQLVRAVGEQLGGYRKRALAAEARVRTLEEASARVDRAVTALEAERDALRQQVADAARSAARMSWPEGLPSPEHVLELREENALLRARLEEVGQRTRTLFERVKFARQQADVDPAAPATEESV